MSILIANLLLQARPGLVVLKGVQIDATKANAAKSMTVWQSVFDKGLVEGKTPLWDDKLRKQLGEGMLLPVPKELLRVVTIKTEK